MKLRFMFTVSILLLTALPAMAHWDLKGYEWAVVTEDDSMSVALDRDDDHQIDRLRRSHDKPFVWVRRGESEWIITDPATVRQLRKIMTTPVELEDVRHRMDEGSEALEDSMRDFEKRVPKLERELDECSLDAALELAEAARELKTDELESATDRLEEGARELGRWAGELEQRLIDEALPLIEHAIRSGEAKRLR